jgi:thymidylate synthase
MSSIIDNTIQAKTIGEAWICLVEKIISSGEDCFDEGRKRKALMDVRLRIEEQRSQDPIIYRYGNPKNIKAILDLTFSKPEMYDVDVVPSFSKGPKSYYQRIQEGGMVDFIVERLGSIPESKKAVMVFPTYEDYKQVLANPKDDYLPCLVSLQYRLRKNNDCNALNTYALNTNAYFRSIDAYQKAGGNLEAIAKITELIALRIAQKTFWEIKPGYLDVMIADAHIYENTVEDAKKVLEDYRRREK